MPLERLYFMGDGYSVFYILVLSETGFISLQSKGLSREIPGLISFRMDWLDLLAVQGTLKILQHHSSKATILLHLAFFTVQLSHTYMTTGKTIVLTRQIFVGKVMSLLFKYAV